MRIVYMLTSLGVGGTERLALALAARMVERGHQVELVVLRRLGEEWTTELPVIQLELRKTPPSALAGLLRARRCLSAFRPDLVHSHGFHANLLARALRLLAPGPALIATVHNVYEGGALRMLAYRATDRLSDCTTAVSAAVARRFIEAGAIAQQRCLVMQNAIETAEFQPDAARRAAMRAAMDAGENFVWLAAGRIAAGKDYPTLLRAFAQVYAAAPLARLWIAGESRAGQERALPAMAAKLGLSGSVRWLGLRRDMPALLDAADGFVSSSAWEGMPLSIAEAMAMEKPVVATGVGGVRELVGDAGAVVPARDREALAAAMAGMMRCTAEERRTLGYAARQRIAQHFSLQTRAAEWEDLYLEVGNGRSRFGFAENSP